MKEIVLPLPTEMDSEAINRVKSLASEHYGGFTTTDGRGGWKSPDGDVITEPVEVLTVVADDETESGTTPQQWARTMARCLARNTDQTEIMWYVRTISAGGFETGER